MKRFKRTIAIVFCMALLTQLISVAQTGTAATSKTDKLEITANNVNVDIWLSDDGQYKYDYDDSEYAVTTDKNGSTLKIKVKAKPGSGKDWDKRVRIYIPDQNYKHIKAVSNKSGLGLAANNSDITVKNNSGAVSVKLPSNYNKTLKYTGICGSGSLAMNKNKDFDINAKFSGCSVAVPNGWPAYSNGSSDYNYKRGKGTAKINIGFTKGSFAFAK